MLGLAGSNVIVLVRFALDWYLRKISVKNVTCVKHHTGGCRLFGIGTSPPFRKLATLGTIGGLEALKVCSFTLVFLQYWCNYVFLGVVTQ